MGDKGQKSSSQSAQDPKVQEAYKLVKKADKLTKLGIFNWSADWAEATPLYEQAASAFKLAKMPEAAKTCYEKAGTGQERLSSPWTAGKHMESAGVLAKELGNVDETIDLYRRASELFMQCGKAQPSADVLGRGARAVEDVKPEMALKMYLDACSMLEEDGREQMAFDTYRATVNLYIKLERFQDAATMLMRWGQSVTNARPPKVNAKMDVFFKSDQGGCAEKLLAAYREGNSDEIKHVVNSSHIIPHLDHMIVRLAKQLPKGELKPSEKADIAEPSGEELNEDDLT